MARIAPLNIDWKPDRTTGEPVTEQIVGYMCEQVHSCLLYTSDAADEL